MNSTPNRRVVLIVVGSLAFGLVGYVSTLAYCSVTGTQPNEDVLTAFKDIGIFCSGALATLLARTGNTSDAPQQVVTTPDKPLDVNQTNP